MAPLLIKESLNLICYQSKYYKVLYVEFEVVFYAVSHVYQKSTLAKGK